MKLLKKAAIGATVLALGIGPVTAHAQDGIQPGGPNPCSVHNQGNSNNIACRDLLLGNNHTAGTGNTASRVTMPQARTISVTNSSSYDLIFLSCEGCETDNAPPPNTRFPSGQNAVAFFGVPVINPRGMYFTFNYTNPGSTTVQGELTIGVNGLGALNCWVSTPARPLNATQNSEQEINVLDGPPSASGMC
ncbi:hypothetical protein AB0D37_41015 [Streptomyces sp. NPDC048384]|uniref:hypothetical protein n=1 Tax=Streptomyces sp. NPDC048384 TaxID=3155487 RepID=UPI00342A5517